MTGVYNTAVRAIHKLSIFADTFQQCLFCQEAALQNLLQDSSRPIFVAVEDNTLLGYCFCVIKDYRGSGVQTDRVEVYIDDLCVEETCRGQGVATALYRHVTNWAKELGCAFISLNVWCGNDSAMAFYEKMGMTPRHIMMELKI